MTAGRITTRAGRKIRHVAPDYTIIDRGKAWNPTRIVDIATGIVIDRDFRSSPSTSFNVNGYRVCIVGCDSQARALAKIARAEATCALVRVLVQVAAEAESLHHVYEEES